MKYPLVHRKEGVNPWVSYFHQRVRKNNSLNVAYLGEPGTGKSWASLAMAEQYDPDWSLDNCYFRAFDLMRDMKDNKFKKGTYIMYDEAGVDLNNTAWQSELNRGMNLVFQTMRHRNWL